MNKIETRTDIINFLIKKFNFKSYLEIGVQNTAANFDKIQCPYKIGIDPDENSGATYTMTSDEFFKQNKRYFDIIFIDGLHEYKQVLKDIKNSLKFINHKGYIVMHDCNPVTEDMQRVPRIQKEWTGDTWKALVKTRTMYPNLNIRTVNIDYGIGVISKQGKSPIINIKDSDLSYDNLNTYRKEWLNLMSVEGFLKTI